ncbi:hypothetical protein WH5701_07781 [Synechococcus sp. WH 5701]|nr:hypothetical protein WH5701_07781 [Synechococcus sp. WH 5701]
MTNGSEPAPSGSPYERLGVTPDASFDEVQMARQRQLEAVAGDPQARAKVEAAYDAVVMERLRERQQGKVSSGAVTASKREEIKPAPARVPSWPSRGHTLHVGGHLQIHPCDGGAHDHRVRSRRQSPGRLICGGDSPFADQSGFRWQLLAQKR